MAEGDEVKLRSRYSAPGDGVTYWFSGTLSGDTLSGSVFLGEYLTAKFTAKRAAYRAGNDRIVVPGGPPLAT